MRLPSGSIAIGRNEYILPTSTTVGAVPAITGAVGVVCAGLAGVGWRGGGTSEQCNQGDTRENASRLRTDAR